MTIDRKQLANDLLIAAATGSLVTPKHDPASGLTAWPSYRTILTPAASSSLDGMLRNGDFTAEQYQDPRHPNPCYVLRPHSSHISPTALGIPSGSVTPSGSCDRFLVASGSQSGWKIYGIEQTQVNANVAANTWRHSGPLA